MAKAPLDKDFETDLDAIENGTLDWRSLATSSDPDDRLAARQIQAYAFSRHGIDFNTIPEMKISEDVEINPKAAVDEVNQKFGAVLNDPLSALNPFLSSEQALDMREKLKDPRDPRSVAERDRDTGAGLSSFASNSMVGAPLMRAAMSAAAPQATTNDLDRIVSAISAAERTAESGAYERGNWLEDAGEWIKQRGIKNAGDTATFLGLGKALGPTGVVGEAVLGPSAARIAAQGSGNALKAIGLGAGAAGGMGYLSAKAPKYYETGEFNPMPDLNDAIGIGTGALAGAGGTALLREAPNIARATAPVLQKAAGSLRNLPVIDNALDNAYRTLLSLLPEESVLRGGEGVGTLYDTLPPIAKKGEGTAMAQYFVENPSLRIPLDKAIDNLAAQNPALGLRNTSSLASETAKLNQKLAELNAPPPKPVEPPKAPYGYPKPPRPVEAPRRPPVKLDPLPDNVFEQPDLPRSILQDAKRIASEGPDGNYIPAKYDANGIPTNPGAQYEELIEQLAPDLYKVNQKYATDEALSPVLLEMKQRALESPSSRLQPNRAVEEKLSQVLRALDAGPPKSAERRAAIAAIKDPKFRDFATRADPEKLRQVLQDTFEANAATKELYDSVRTKLAGKDASDEAVDEAMRMSSYGLAGLTRLQTLSGVRAASDLLKASGEKEAIKALLRGYSTQEGIQAGGRQTLTDLIRKVEAREAVGRNVRDSLAQVLPGVAGTTTIDDMFTNPNR